MKIRNKCIFDDYKSQIISALKTERFLNFPKKKDCDLLYIFTYFFFCQFFTALFGSELHSFRYFKVKQIR